MLHSEPSFCIYADEDGKGDMEMKSSEVSGGGEFSFAERSMGLIVEDEENGIKDSRTEQMEPVSPKMYLATGFGIDGIGGLEFTPTDGESLVQYAKLAWEVDGDKERALSYFERAALASPGDCNILAAYASFLWEIDEDSDHGGLNQGGI